MPRRTIAELLAIYALEGEVRDAFVEGPRDCGFYKWFLRQKGINDVTVYEVGMVDVADELVVRRGLRVGAKGRVLALAHALEEGAVADLRRRVACLVDADEDYVLGVGVAGTLAWRTDYTSIEMYGWRAEAIEKVVVIVLGRGGVDAARVLGEMEKVLGEVFLIRAAALASGVGGGRLEIGRVCVLAGGRIEFDRDEYVKRFLNKAGEPGRKGEIESVVSGWRGRRTGDMRQFIYGDDCMELFRWYVVSSGATAVPDWRTLGRMLLGCVEVGDLEKEAGLRELVERLQ